MQLNVKKLSPEAKLPTYGTVGSACFDIYSLVAGVVAHDDPLVIETGLAFEVPEGYVMLVFSRSGHGFNYDVRLANCVGVIDSDYRGELKVKLTCDDPKLRLDEGCYGFAKGERIAQGMLIPVVQNVFKEVDTLSDTTRNGGFGSTGK